MRFLIPLVAVIVFTLPAFASSLININSADHATLTTLNGIVDAKATAIIEYRESHGPFATIEDIMNVSGIGTVTFNNIKNFITVNEPTSHTPPETQTSEDNQASEVSPSGGGGFVVDSKNISLDVGGKRTAFVGADSVFEADVTGLVGEPLDTARVVWTFGNGDRREGQKVLYHFAYPGTYVVVADASSGKYSASDRFIVKVVPAQLHISDVTTEYVILANEGDIEIDIGGWILFSDGGTFIFPQKTIILANEEVFVANARTGLAPSSPHAVSLLYPNGAFATSYQSPLIVARRATSESGSSLSSGQQNVNVLSSNEETRNTIAQQGLITAPILAVDPQTTMDRDILPPILGWVLVLLAVVGIAVIGVLFVRKGEYREYSIEEVQE